MRDSKKSIVRVFNLKEKKFTRQYIYDLPRKEALIAGIIQENTSINATEYLQIIEEMKESAIGGSLTYKTQNGLLISSRACRRCKR